MKIKMTGYEHMIDDVGNEFWTLNGFRHRVDGPAVICRDGLEAWYLHGNLHRIGGPAIYSTNGFERWYQKGVLHRVDGPAFIERDSTVEFLLNGYRYRDNLKFQLSAKLTDEQMLVMILKYGNVRCDTWRSLLREFGDEDEW